jgi:hypothetical protein
MKFESSLLMFFIAFCCSAEAFTGVPSWNLNSGHTDKKENQIFLVYKEIQSGALAKSYMKKGFLIYEEIRKYFPIYEELLVIYDFAHAPLWISLYCIWENWFFCQWQPYSYPTRYQLGYAAPS